MSKAPPVDGVDLEIRQVITSSRIMARKRLNGIRCHRPIAFAFMACSVCLVFRSISMATWSSNKLSTTSAEGGVGLPLMTYMASSNRTLVDNHDVSPEIYDNRNSVSDQLIERQRLRRRRHPGHQLLLSVPFYVYDDLVRLNDTYLGGIPLEQAISQRWQKHSLDYWFAKASLDHPMRTHDPSEAKLFVIPLLMNLYSLRVYSPSSPVNANRNVTRSRNVTLCWNMKQSDMKDNDNQAKNTDSSDIICDKALLKYAAKVLNSSTWFHRNEGRDHIIVTSHYGYKLKGKLNMPPLLRKMIASCHAISYENRKYNIPTRQSYPSLLVGNPCHAQDHQDYRQSVSLADSSMITKKTHEVAFIGNLLDPAGNYYEDRHNICLWINDTYKAGSATAPTSRQHSLNHQQQQLPLVSICGRGKQCPALSLAKYGFHAKGDTFGSQRLMDALLSGTVPLFTRSEQYDIVPPWIDWSKISYFVNVSNRESFKSSLHQILYNTSEEEYTGRRKAVLANRDLFDWKASLVPFDTYMYMLQAYLFPETKRPMEIANRYDALILP